MPGFFCFLNNLNYFFISVVLSLEKRLYFLKHFLIIITFLIGFKTFAQSDALARQYFEDGSFEKAALYYEKLYAKNPNRADYLQYLIECHQQLEKYELVESILLPKINTPFFPPNFLVELGYNYALQNKDDEAKKYYELAINRINENPGYAFVVGNSFKKKILLDYALRTYRRSMELTPNNNLNLEIARIYGEQGKIEKMFTSYLDLINNNRAYKPNILRNINQFIGDDPEEENNILLKKALLKKSQADPDVLWNELLSWLFIQQKQFRSAFAQEKAILKRSELPNIQRLVDLGLVSLEENDFEIATTVFEYVIENTSNRSLQLRANLYIIDFELQQASEKDYADINEKYKVLIQEFGNYPETIELQAGYAKFLAFYMDKIDDAQELLKESLKLPLNRFQKANIKITLADILVYDEKFNQALIYYSQVQKSLKNDVIAQTARFKVAKTSFYKGDFDWSLTQLKVLRSSTTQLIANDAMQLSLLISDNSLEDSTQTALKIFAKADLLAYQNKDKSAIDLLDKIITDHKGESIEDEALLKQGKLLEKSGQYDRARLNYIKIIEFFAFDILADDALYALGELYKNHLNDPEKAKEYYEKIILDHADSIFAVDARKKYRKLRGDAIN
ncbi:tetratricopeptide repeat protein [Flavobacteriaceae bacterium R38]|nr:tetratricopeptide repeat protein [Flavobacteriaceae bacterium R38]